MDLDEKDQRAVRPPRMSHLYNPPHTSGHRSIRLPFIYRAFSAPWITCWPFLWSDPTLPTAFSFFHLVTASEMASQTLGRSTLNHTQV